ncbi:MAG TPA: NAD-dependent epimerase/dehydratase family protein [Solirubrobacterales bacterium]
MEGAAAGSEGGAASGAKKTLTVAVTGPTGDIGRALMRALDDEPTVGRVIGMARSPFDPADAGWEKAEYRQGDILDVDSVAALVGDADVVVHLAFIILGGRDETRKINLEGTRNVFEAALGANIDRFVYTSSVAAYGFHDENPQPLTEDVEPRGSEGFYYSAQKAELEAELRDSLAASDVDAYIFRPCIVAGPDALTLVEQVVEQYQIGGRLPIIQRALEGLPFLAPVIPDPGVPFQLVHHDDVAAALVAAIRGDGEPGTYNLAAEGELRAADLARELGWWSVPVPHAAIAPIAEGLSHVPGMPSQVAWLNAFKTPVIMDASRARETLGWEPEWDSAETLHQMVSVARRENLLG